MSPLPPSGRVFLTGGTGLVGSHTASLLRSRGYAVRALHRSTSRVDHLQELGCELVEGTLPTGRSEMERFMGGCDAVVHAAAVIYSDLPWQQVREINVESTEEVLRGASAVGIGRAVLLSSVAVYGTVRGRIDEGADANTPLKPREFYARSKREAEQVAHRVATDSDIAVVVLRASAVYGERDRLFTPKLARALRLPIQPLLGTGRTHLPVIYAGNLAHAVLAGLTGPARPGIRTYNVAEDHPVTQRRLYGALSDVLGVPFRPVPLPSSLVLSGAWVAERVGLRIPGATELPLGRAARLAVRDNPYLSERIRDELGWFAPVQLDESLERTGRWVRDGWTG